MCYRKIRKAITIEINTSGGGVCSQVVTEPRLRVYNLSEGPVCHAPVRRRQDKLSHNLFVEPLQYLGHQLFPFSRQICGGRPVRTRPGPSANFKNSRMTPTRTDLPSEFQGPIRKQPKMCQNSHENATNGPLAHTHSSTTLVHQCYCAVREKCAAESGYITDVTVQVTHGSSKTRCLTM